MAKVIKILSFVLVVVFFVMFFSSSSGYYEYELNKKSNLTKEAIEKFEEDVKEGKEIDVKDYLVKDNKDYSNNFSKMGLALSNKIGKTFEEGVKLIFKSVGKLIDD